jgi:hypothetical protein
MGSTPNTITDDQGNKYELYPSFDHDTQKDGYILVYVPEFKENDIL